MFQNIGFGDWVIILLIVLVLFGGKRLPELAKSLGRSISAFKNGLKESEEEVKKSLEDKKDPNNPPLN